MRVSLAIQNPRAYADVPARSTLRRWVGLALTGDRRSAQFVLRFVDAREGRALNRTYRGRDYATNVLTFNYDADRTVAADIVVCMPVVRAEARAQHKSLRAHLAHLVVHGVLHARGFDHERPADARRMERREIALLAHLKIANPYA